MYRLCSLWVSIWKLLATLSDILLPELLKADICVSRTKLARMRWTGLSRGLGLITLSVQRLNPCCCRERGAMQKIIEEPAKADSSKNHALEPRRSSRYVHNIICTSHKSDAIYYHIIVRLSSACANMVTSITWSLTFSSC